MTKHTPTPYKLVKHRKVGLEADEVFNTIEKNDGLPRQEIIARVPKVENAEFIVRACNSHEALIQACEDALNLIVSLSEHEAMENETEREISDTETFLEKTLKQAKGE